MDKTWIVVADSAQARILAAIDTANAPVEAARLVHPDSRLKEGELVTDKPGRDRNGSNRHAMDETHAHVHEQEAFARSIVETLEDGRQHGRFSNLILVAPPHFLGTLRQALNNQLTKLVSQSLDKNLVNDDEDSVRRHLFH